MSEDKFRLKLIKREAYPFIINLITLLMPTMYVCMLIVHCVRIAIKIKSHTTPMYIVVGRVVYTLLRG